MHVSKESDMRVSIRRELTLRTQKRVWWYGRWMMACVCMSFGSLLPELQDKVFAWKVDTRLKDGSVIVEAVTGGVTNQDY